MKKGNGVASHELLREVFKPQGVKRVAAGMGKSRWLVHKWTEPVGENESGLINPLDYTALLLLVTGDRRLAQWVCEQADGYYVPNPAVNPVVSEAWLPATRTVMQELGGLQSAVAGTLKDKPLTPAEVRALRRLWEDMKSDMERYVTRLEQGTFRCGALFLSLGWWFATGEVLGAESV